MADDKQKVPDPGKVNEVAPDAAATKGEAAAYTTRSLGKDSKKQEHRRREGLRDHAYWGMVFVFWLLMISTLVVIFAIAWHSLAPDRWAWLNDGQLDLIKHVFSGAIVAAIGGYVRRYI